VKYCIWCNNAEIRRPHMRTKYFRFLSQMKRLENYLSYMCTKFGENQLKTMPAIVDEMANFVTAEVGCRACVLNKSVLATNGTISAPFIWEPMFQIW